jgi:hypothetical protein
MNPIIKALRRLVPEEIKALLEKIDSFDSATDSSYYDVNEYMRKARLTRLERALLRDAMYRIERRDAMVNAMNIVIYNHTDRGFYTGGVISGSVFNGISSEVDRQFSIYQNAEAARQQAAAVERKKVVVRRKPAGA